MAAKASPAKLDYASPGIGTSPHMAIELFKRVAGVEMTHVPYKGGGPAITDVDRRPCAAGDGHRAGGPAAGQGRQAASAGDAERRRSPIVPDVPTVAEPGFAGFENAVWYGIVAPAGLPAEMVATLNREMKARACRDRGARATGRRGARCRPAPRRGFADAAAEREMTRWGKLIRDAGIKPD